MNVLKEWKKGIITFIREEHLLQKDINLPAKYVIHTVGPIIYSEVTEQEELQLINCYTNSLELAIENGIRTIAFPCISTGEFRFPEDKASKLAILAVNNFLKEHGNSFNKVVFNVYGEKDYKIYERNIKQNWKNKKFNKYGEFLDNTKNKKVVLLEFGVGFNTPGIIRFPFEQMTYQNTNWNLIRFNKDNCMTFLDIQDKTIEVADDINDAVNWILE